MGNGGINVSIASKIRVSVASFCYKCIDIFFAVLCVAIIFATLMFDKNIGNPFPNVAKYSNGGYYFVAALILCGIIWLLLKVRNADIEPKVFYAIIGIMAIVTAVLQTIVAFWAPAEFPSTTDFGHIQQMTINLADGGTFAGDSYFEASANNVHLTILLSWVYGIVHNWRIIVWLGAMLTGISGLFASLTIFNMTKNKLITIISMFIINVFMIFTWRCYITYTDNWGMPFAVAVVWLHSTKLRKEVKAPLILFCTLVGAWIKVTTLISLLGIIIHVIFKILLGAKNNYKCTIKQSTIVSVSLCIVLIVGGNLFSNGLRENYGYISTESTKKIQYMFMAGQDESGIGTVGGQEYKVKWKEICSTYETSKERMNACMNVALTWIKERGFAGNIIYYLKKVDVAYGDGYFHNVQRYDKSIVEKNFIYEIFSNDGKYYYRMAGIMQVLWDMFLLLIASELFINLILKATKREHALFRIIILGVTCYLMLFEGRSKYLFMFLPIYMAYAGIMMNEILKFTDVMRTALSFYQKNYAESEKVSNENDKGING